MEFADNSRISHKQLYYQMILAWMSPFLLCLYQKNMALGVTGLSGVAISCGILLFYVIFLVRLTSCMEDLRKSAGSIMGRLAGLYLLVYIIWTAVFILGLLGEIVPKGLLGKIREEWISLAAVLVCSVGADRGMQRRGRMAEVAGRIFLGGLLLMLLTCIFQGRVSYLKEMMEQKRSLKDLAENAYGILCAFSGIGLLPISLEYVERRKNVAKPIGCALLTIAGLLTGFGLVLPAVFGWKRLLAEKYPVLPLLAGANLPGNVLARFDILWLGLLLFGLLFSLGSLFHYGNLVVAKAHLPNGKIWLPVLVWLLSVFALQGEMRTEYVRYLKIIFVPGLLVLQFFLILIKRKKWRKRTAAAGTVAGILCVCLFLSGCMGIEPEKRMYPLALGIDVKQNGDFTVEYGVPDLPQAEGQRKSEEGNSMLELSGESMKKIREKYTETQEKYLDLGHVGILVLGDRLVESDRWEEVLKELKEEKIMGENMYVFSAEKVKEILGWQGDQGTSVGEYVQGLMENHPGKSGNHVPTLREVYHAWYDKGKLSELPRLEIVEEGLRIGD